jgi:uncharacterized membrane protein
MKVADANTSASQASGIDKDQMGAFGGAAVGAVGGYLSGQLPGAIAGGSVGTVAGALNKRK